MTKVAITGAGGRMGKSLLQAVYNNESLELGATIVKKDNPLLGKDISEIIGVGTTGILAVENITDVIDDFDILIDFTAPQHSMDNLEVCLEHKKQLIIGTTGFNKKQLLSIAYAANDIAIISSPNMSMGINLCASLVETATTAIGQSTDIDVLDLHHNKKVDAPSGTALQFGKIIAANLGCDLEDAAIYSRHENKNPRKPNEIGFSSIRAGNIIGEHKVIFAGNGEIVEITHKASGRETFAQGALQAVMWLTDKKTGLFDMQDVLGVV